MYEIRNLDEISYYFVNCNEIAQQLPSRTNNFSRTRATRYIRQEQSAKSLYIRNKGVNTHIFVKVY
jgi:hypothetical protein